MRLSYFLLLYGEKQSLLEGVIGPLLDLINFSAICHGYGIGGLDIPKSNKNDLIEMKKKKNKQTNRKKKLTKYTLNKKGAVSCQWKTF